jgi:hypothetical protein
MNSENRDEELIFGEALRLSGSAEREACLHRVCVADDPA